MCRRIDSTDQSHRETQGIARCRKKRAAMQAARERKRVGTPEVCLQAVGVTRDVVAAALALICIMEDAINRLTAKPLAGQQQLLEVTRSVVRFFARRPAAPSRPLPRSRQHHQRTGVAARP
jgi:hypothetical protein